MLHPEIQQRAQSEVDSIVGQEHRLPTLADRPSMTYLDCILQEVLRWATVSPMGLFHCTSEDDTYADYDIPARTTVIPNIWAMLHDESQYPEPLKFNPDRFANDGVTKPQRDPRTLAFGFGRRICPGQHIAEASVFIQMATILSTLHISKAINDNGQVIEPEIAFTTAIVRYAFFVLISGGS
jgi:cytochrome P450